MEMQKRTLFRFILFFTCLLFAIAVSAAKPDAPPGKPGNGGDTGFSHEDHFTKHLYEGTATCNTCHMQEAEDVLTTGHWKWQGIAANVEGVENEVHGKKDFINNFCVAVPTNEGRCAQC
ncbi:MAG: hypothetical protein KAI22_02435, partial [Gammaproteobacteria bacterium]|nr:hypothetical protein [Gammaproteobacteria bacterium]